LITSPKALNGFDAPVRVAVRRRFGGERGADRAGSARPVVDDELVAEDRRQPRPDQARERIDRTAGRKGNDEAHRPDRPGVLREARERAEHTCECEACCE
jgi:hypothetical protein